MAANVKPIYPDVQNVGTKKFTISDSTNLAALVTAGTDGTRVDDVIVTSDSAVDIDMQAWINDGADDFLLGTVEIPAGAGNSSSVDPVSLFDSLPEIVIKTDALYVPASYALKLGLKTALASGKYIYATGLGGDY